MPDIFLLSHPVGTVLGRAKFEDFFVVHQRVTVGGDKDLNYPTFQKGVISTDFVENLLGKELK